MHRLILLVHLQLTRGIRYNILTHHQHNTQIRMWSIKVNKKSLPSTGNARIGAVVKRVLSLENFLHIFNPFKWYFLLSQNSQVSSNGGKILDKSTIIASESHKTPKFCHSIRTNPVLNRLDLLGIYIAKK